MGTLHHTERRLPAPDKLKGTDAARRMDIFSLSVCLAPLSSLCFSLLAARRQQGTAEDKCRRKHEIFPWEEDIILPLSLRHAHHRWETLLCDL